MENTFIAHKTDTEIQTVKEHSENTAELAKQFAAAFGAGNLAYTIGLCHDLGKYSAAFQRRINGGNNKTDHSTAGGKTLHNLYDNLFGKLCAYCIFGHHGGLPNGGSGADKESDSTLQGRLKKEIENFDCYKNEIVIPSETCSIDFNPKDCFSFSFFTRFIFSCLVDADFLDTENFMQKKSRGGYAGIACLQSKLQEYLSEKGKSYAPSEINRKRNEILQDCIGKAKSGKGLYTLTAPTGSGKTISSLAFSLNHALLNNLKRVIFVVPYNTITEQNAKVFEDILGSENVIQHHSGVEYDGGEDDLLNKKKLAAENWDAPIIVTSSVQFFESLYSNRTSACRKLHNIAESVIVFDEVQTLPVNFLKPCIRGISELVERYNCTAVLCTATQPALNKYFEPLKPVEILREPETMYGFFRRVNVVSLDGKLTDGELCGEIISREQVLCIVNTRKTAQNIFKKISNGSDEGMFCLTTAMTPLHRTAVLDEIRKRLKENLPCRAVSTSLVEAGVDLDFPVVYREKTGLDSIIQSAGRCNREGKREKEKSNLFVFEQEQAKYNTPNISAFEYVKRNFTKDFTSLPAVREYFEQYFYIKGDEATDSEKIIERLSKPSVPFKDVSDDFRIIPDLTVSVFVGSVFGNERDTAKQLEQCLRKNEMTRSDYRQARKYSASLFKKEADSFVKKGIIELAGEHYILANPELNYDKNAGILLEPEMGKEIFS
jgi:CRISPR-associated endonuclease/helicase Cas3